MQQAEQDQAALHLVFAIHRTHTRSRTSNRLSHIRKKSTRCLFIRGKGGKSKKKQDDKINRIAAILYSYWCTVLK